MIKSKSIFFIFTVLIGLFFISCGKTKLTSPLQLVEIDIEETEQYNSLKLLVSRTEITQSLFEEVMKQNPSSVKDPELPVTNIKLEDAALFCNRLNKIYGFEPVYKIEKSENNPSVTYIENSKGFRLLTKHESNIILNKTCYKNSSFQKKGWTGTRLHKAAHYEADELGLFDYSGNALEYVYSEKGIQKNDFGTISIEELQKHIQRDKITKYEEYLYTEDELTSFRICCPDSVSKSDLDILKKDDVAKAKEKWEKENLEKLFDEISFVKCDEYSFKTKGINIDDTKTDITVFVPELNVSKTEISKPLFDFVTEGRLFDGIETPDYKIDFFYSYNNYVEDDFKTDNTAKTNATYMKSIIFCNKLSTFKGLTPCYEIQKLKKPVYYHSGEEYYVKKFNPDANGYRLPTKSEFRSFIDQFNSNSEISFNESHWNWTYDSYTEQLLTTDLYCPYTEYNTGNKVISRFAGKDKKPINNFVNYYTVHGIRDPKSPNFCLRLFQTANTDKIKEYREKQTEAAKAKLNEIFDQQITMFKNEGGLKTFKNVPDAEIADFEMSEQYFSDYLYKTIMSTICHSDDTNDSNGISLAYDKTVEALNRLSQLKDLEECYYLKDNHWECDYTKNGYRLPTIAECLSTETSNNKSLCNDIFTGDEILVWETSFPHGVEYLEGASNNRSSLGFYTGITDRITNSFVLCRTLDIEKMKELLKKNAEEKKELTAKLDEILDMVEFEGGSYKLNYMNSSNTKELSKTRKIKPFYIQKSKLSAKLKSSLIDYSSNSYSNPYASLNFFETLMICNKLSRIANLTPVYKVNGSYDLNYSEINNLIENKTHITISEIAQKEDFDFTIEYDNTADGYQLPSEVEWEYAGTYGSTSEEGIHILSDISNLSSGTPTASGLYLMNTSCSEWCFDEGPVKSSKIDNYHRESHGDEFYSYPTRIARYHCGNHTEKYRTSGYYSNTYDIEKRFESSLRSENSFRVLRYK